MRRNQVAVHEREPALIIRSLLSMTILAASLSACTWVKLTDAGKSVRVANIGEAADCERVGEASAHVLDKVAFVKRSREKQARELATLARNEAGQMGGNTVVAMSAIENGSRRFAVYRCR